MRSFQVSEVLRQLSRDGSAWSELLRTDSLSLGVYRLRLESPCHVSDVQSREAASPVPGCGGRGLRPAWVLNDCR